MYLIEIFIDAHVCPPRIPYARQPVHIPGKSIDAIIVKAADMGMSGK